jgi:hypothetical protein
LSGCDAQILELIDVVFLDSEPRVLLVREAVLAWRAVKERGAKATQRVYSSAQYPSRIRMGIQNE